MFDFFAKNPETQFWPLFIQGLCPAETTPQVNVQNKYICDTVFPLLQLNTLMASQGADITEFDCITKQACPTGDSFLVDPSKVDKVGDQSTIADLSCCNVEQGFCDGSKPTCTPSDKFTVGDVIVTTEDIPDVCCVDT